MGSSKGITAGKRCFKRRRAGTYASADDSSQHKPTARASGLLRTPLSGGVNSATLSQGLPPPAVAVRNLMEQRAGHPVFALSPLAIHTRNLEQDPRASLVVQMPGWSGEANARVTMFGDVHVLPERMQAPAVEVFQSNRTQGAYSERWGNFTFWSFVGGFGTVQWINVSEYVNGEPDAIVADSCFETLELLNERFSSCIQPLLTAPSDDSSIVSIDARGIDVRVRRGAQDTVERINFPNMVLTREDATRELNNLLRSVRN